MTHCRTPRSFRAAIRRLSWPTLIQVISSTSPASAGSVSCSKPTATSRLTPMARAWRANINGKERLPAISPQISSDWLNGRRSNRHPRWRQRESTRILASQGPQPGGLAGPAQKGQSRLKRGPRPSDIRRVSSAGPLTENHLSAPPQKGSAARRLFSLLVILVLGLSLGGGILAYRE